MFELSENSFGKGKGLKHHGEGCDILGTLLHLWHSLFHWQRTHYYSTDTITLETKHCPRHIHDKVHYYSYNRGFLVSWAFCEVSCVIRIRGVSVSRETISTNLTSLDSYGYSGHLHSYLVFCDLCCSVSPLPPSRPSARFSGYHWLGN